MPETRQQRKRREFDENKVKRDEGRFARVEKKKAMSGMTVRNDRGTQGKLIGRTPDGMVIVRLPDGSSVQWHPSSLRRAHGKLPDEKTGKGGKGGGGGSGGGKGSGGETAARTKTERAKAMRFLAKIQAEIDRAKAEPGRPARLFIADEDIMEVSERFRAAGLPSRVENGRLIVDFPSGPVEIHNGRRLRRDGALQEEIDAEKAAKDAAREAEREAKRAQREREREARKAARERELEASRRARARS